MEKEFTIVLCPLGCGSSWLKFALDNIYIDVFHEGMFKDEIFRGESAINCILNDEFCIEPIYVTTYLTESDKKLLSSLKVNYLLFSLKEDGAIEDAILKKINKLTPIVLNILNKTSPLNFWKDKWLEYVSEYGVIHRSLIDITKEIETLRFSEEMDYVSIENIEKMLKNYNISFVNNIAIKKQNNLNE